MNVGKNLHAIKFFKEMHALSEKYWCPDISNESYWDDMAYDSIKVIEAYTTDDLVWNEYVGDTVAAFMNMQEAMSNLVK